MRYIASLILFTTLISSHSFAQNESALDIALRVDQADSGWKDQEVNATMTLYAANGRSVTRALRSLSLESNEGDRSLVIFDQPRDVKGTVFLTHTYKQGNDDQWLFLPAIKRIKRISSSNRSGPFMGSEFAYEDISSEEIERYTYDGLQASQCSNDNNESIDCYIYNRYPVDKSSGYTKQIVSVDKSHYRILNIDYYDRKDSHQKTLTREQYQKFGNYWRASRWLMVNHLNNKKTTVEWDGWQFASGLSPREFEKAALKNY